MSNLNSAYPGYHAYLLRFWEERGQTSAQNPNRTWRFSLEDPRAGERRGFANLEHLLAFLNEQMNNSLTQEKTQ